MIQKYTPPSLPQVHPKHEKQRCLCYATAFKKSTFVKNMIFLKGNKVHLRGLSESDLNGNYVHWLNDTEVCEYNNHHRFAYSKSQAEEYIKSSYNKHELVLAMCDNETDIHIGNISLQKIDWINRNAEFAILLGEKTYWGKGFAKEAAKLIIKHGFMELNLTRIYCGTSKENIGMQKLALALGMVHEGTREKALFKHGTYTDILEYGLINPNF
ncbi:MAG: GNAT family N-acetyltransferase [Arenicella sp.]